MLSPAEIRGIVEQGVVAAGEMLAGAGLDPRLIYVMTEPGWAPNTEGGPLAAVTDLYARLETAIACTWPKAMQAWYIAGWHHTRPNQRHPEWPASLRPVFGVESATLYRVPEGWQTVRQVDRPLRLAWVGLQCWYDQAGQRVTGEFEQCDRGAYVGLGSLFRMMQQPPEVVLLYTERATLSAIVDGALAVMAGLALGGV